MKLLIFNNKVKLAVIFALTLSYAGIVNAESAKKIHNKTNQTSKVSPTDNKPTDDEIKNQIELVTNLVKSQKIKDSIFNCENETLIFISSKGDSEFTVKDICSDGSGSFKKFNFDFTKLEPIQDESLTSYPPFFVSIRGGNWDAKTSSFEGVNNFV